jgi:hypothetical protein
VACSRVVLGTNTIYAGASRSWIYVQVENMPSFNLGLEVARQQFTETVWLFKEKLLNNFHFNVGLGSDNQWPITSWGASFEL